MPHARSLRPIGQSLETAHIEAFTLDKKNNSYVMRSESLTPTRQWIVARNSIVETVWDSLAHDQKRPQLTGGDGWVCYDPVVISRLEAQGRQKRRSNFARAREARLSSLMRAVGAQLDIMQVNSFSLFWAPDSVSVEYETRDGQRERRDFSVEKLRELSLRMRFRRSNRDT